jgi:hypothetical protein
MGRLPGRPNGPIGPSPPLRCVAEVSARLVGAAAFKAVGTGDPCPAGSIPVHLRHTHPADEAMLRRGNSTESRIESSLMTIDWRPNDWRSIGRLSKLASTTCDSRTEPPTEP